MLLFVGVPSQVGVPRHQRLLPVLTVVPTSAPPPQQQQAPTDGQTQEHLAVQVATQVRLLSTKQLEVQVAAQAHMLSAKLQEVAGSAVPLFLFIMERFIPCKL